MRKIIFVAVLSALAVAPALAEFGEVIRSWYAPGKGNCWGVAWDGEYIWCNVGRTGDPDMMYRCVPSNGSVVSSFETVFSLFILGRTMCYRTWSGRPVLDVSVWDSIGEEDIIIRYYPNGSIADRTGVQLPGGARMSGICFDGSNNWVTDPEEVASKIYKLNDRGVPISSFTLNKPGNTMGITKQDDFFWFTISVHGSFSGFYKTRSNGSVVASFKTSGSSSMDCTYENKHLWVTDSDRVYCYDVSNAPAVAPASLGRVKALFR
jgi:hypothetical protein